MRIEQFAGLTVRLVGGDDREGGGSGPLVILLHGFGAPGTDLVSLYRQLDVPHAVRFAFPEAPVDLGASLGPGYAGGRAWWMLDPAIFEAAARGERPDRTGVVPEGLAEARAQVLSLVTELGQNLGVGPEHIVLGGFSQGAMLTLDVALRMEQKVAGLVLMSGSIVALEEWSPLFERLAETPVLQSHGRTDPLLPFDVATRLTGLLEAGGAKVEFVEFQGGHTITNGVVEALGRFVKKTLHE